MHRRCIDRLDKTAEKYGIPQVNWNVRNEDFLTKQQEGIYDFIIGNPPYITYHDMNEMQREFHIFLPSCLTCLYIVLCIFHLSHMHKYLSEDC